jgi:hypothetical protein
MDAGKQKHQRLTCSIVREDLRRSQQSCQAVCRCQQRACFAQASTDDGWCRLKLARVRILHLQTADLADRQCCISCGRTAGTYRVLEEQSQGAVIRVRARARLIFIRKQRRLDGRVGEQAHVVESVKRFRQAAKDRKGSTHCSSILSSKKRSSSCRPSATARITLACRRWQVYASV